MNASGSNSTLEEKLKFSETGPMIVYGLFLGGIVAPIFPLIGVIFAYILRKDSGDILYTHFSYLIRTFWIALGFYIVLIVIFLLGFFRAISGTDFYSSSFPVPIVSFMVFVFLLALGFFIWYVVRLGLGIRALYLRREIL